MLFFHSIIKIIVVKKIFCLWENTKFGIHSYFLRTIKRLILLVRKYYNSLWLWIQLYANFEESFENILRFNWWSEKGNQYLDGITHGCVKILFSIQYQYTKNINSPIVEPRKYTNLFKNYSYLPNNQLYQHCNCPTTQYKVFCNTHAFVYIAMSNCQQLNTDDTLLRFHRDTYVFEKLM